MLPLRNVIYGYELVKEFGKNKRNYMFGNFANYYYERYKKEKNEHDQISEYISDNTNSKNYIKKPVLRNKENKKKRCLEDDRLKKIDELIKNIFKEKNILDIGCNMGVTTFLLSLKYKCKIVNGIDIDYSLINKNVHLLKLFIEFILLYNGQTHILPFFLNHKKLLQIEKHLFVDLFELYEQTKENTDRKKRDIKLDSDKVKDIEKEKNKKNEKEKNKENEKEKNMENENEKEKEKIKENEKEIYHFPFNMYFMCANIFDKKFEMTENKYDIIICFSVLKWIHLNYGDESLIRFFDTVYKMLQKKGYFIVEYHNEIKYKLRKFEKKYYKHNIKLNYNDFDRLLCGTNITNETNIKNITNGGRMKLLYKINSFHSVKSAYEDESKSKKTKQEQKQEQEREKKQKTDVEAEIEKKKEKEKEMEKEKEIKKKKRKRGMFDRTICIYQKN